MTRPPRPTLADVAARAGVSLKTASRALNGEYGVAEATAQRVHEAAGDLGFRLNYLARALATRQTSATVGLVIPTVSDPFFAALAAEVEATLAPRKLGLISASHGDDMTRQRMLTRVLVERRVAALVVVSAPGDSSYLQLDIDHGLAVGAVDRPLVGVSVDTVTIDNRTAARVAVTELVTAGHRRIAVIGFDARLWTMSERYDGYRDALTDAGISLDADLVALSCGDAVQAEMTVTAMLQAAERTDCRLRVAQPVGPGGDPIHAGHRRGRRPHRLRRCGRPRPARHPTADRRRLRAEAARSGRGRDDARASRRAGGPRARRRTASVVPAPPGSRRQAPR